MGSVRHSTRAARHMRRGDAEGATYPTLNGTSLGGQAHALGDHDLIEIAGVKMEFFYKP